MKTQKLLLSLLALLMVATAWGQTVSITNGVTGGTTPVCVANIAAPDAASSLSVDYDLAGSTYTAGVATMHFELYNIATATTVANSAPTPYTLATAADAINLYTHITWSPNNGAATTLAAGNYRLIAVINQVGKTSKRITMLMKAKTIPAVTATATTPICPGKPVTLGVTGTGHPDADVTYTWVRVAAASTNTGGLLDATTGATITTKATDPLAVAATPEVIRYRVTASLPAHSCSVTDAINVDVVAPVAPALAASAATICLGSTVKLKVTDACVTTGTKIEWYENGGTVLVGTQTITDPLGTSVVV